MTRRYLFALIAIAAMSVVSGRALLAASFTNYSASAFSQALAAGGPVIVHVHADWCPTCRAQAPVLQSMSGEKAYEKARFIRVNFDKDRDFLTSHKVAVQSTILVFKGGKEVARFSGETDASRIRSRIDAAI